MSSTMKFTSQAPLLISCTLPLATVAQQPAGSFRERTATIFSFQQLCPPDFPMPDIWKRQCAEQLDLHAFAPVLAYNLLRLEQTPDLRSFPAENVSGQFPKRAAATPRPHQTPGSGAPRIVALPTNGKPPISLSWDDGPTRHFPPVQAPSVAACLMTVENQQQRKSFFA